MTTNNSVHHALHQAAYLKRRKAGVLPLPKPWADLKQARLFEIASDAYRLATWSSREDDMTPALFFADLQQAFEMLVGAEAQRLGYDATPSGAQGYAERALAEVPKAWRPQYPIYQELTLASACNTPEVLTNVEKSNANDHDSKH